MMAVETNDNVQKKVWGREFSFSDQHFEQLAQVAHELTGIVLGEHKKDMLYGRLVRRLRALKLKDFAEYIELLNQDKSPELDDFVNAITTNLTSFFRENHHFETLENEILPSLIRQSSQKEIRIWSAGCSTGEEPLSIAMVLHRVFQHLPAWKVKVLATDLDGDSLNHGRRAVYDKSRVEGLDTNVLKQNFDYDSKQKVVRVKDHIRNYVTFNRLNLLGPWPMKKEFQIIFCRNVVIYFNKDTQKVLFDRLANQMNSKGDLFIGHSENLAGVTRRFQALGNTHYRRTD